MICLKANLDTIRAINSIQFYIRVPSLARLIGASYAMRRRAVQGCVYYTTYYTTYLL